jgi:hypothetical protein
MSTFEDSECMEETSILNDEMPWTDTSDISEFLALFETGPRVLGSKIQTDIPLRNQESTRYIPLRHQDASPMYICDYDYMGDALPSISSRASYVAPPKKEKVIKAPVYKVSTKMTKFAGAPTRMMSKTRKSIHIGSTLLSRKKQSTIQEQSCNTADIPCNIDSDLDE